MSWVGLWSAGHGAYSPAGLGRRSTRVVDLNGTLPRGSLLLQFSVDVTAGHQVVLDHAATAPERSALRIAVSPDGLLTLSRQYGSDRQTWTVATGQSGRIRDVTLILTWDAPARRARLAVEIADTGCQVIRSSRVVLPFALRDGVRLIADPRSRRLHPSVAFLAVADHVMPLGPLPALAATTPVPTPEGLQPLAQMRPGQLVTLADGSAAQLRWVGSADLPARGRFAPLRLKAPYYRATRDLVGSADQRIHLRGSEVDYLFATPAVACAIGDLSDGVTPVIPPPRDTYRYWGFLLDRPGTLRIGGLDVEGLDVDRLRRDPALRSASVLADLPDELLPQAEADVPVLRGFETRTLCALRVA